MDTEYERLAASSLLQLDRWMDAWERSEIDEVIAKRAWVLRIYSTAGDPSLPSQILSLLDQKAEGIRQHYEVMREERRSSRKKEEEVENEKKRRASEVAVKIAEYVEDTLPLIVERIMNQLPQRKTNEQP